MLAAMGGSLVPALIERYVAAMVLSGAGDLLGFKNGSWEFSRDGPAIHRELQQLGGLEKLDASGWMVSDDTVMHLATAEALADWRREDGLSPLYRKMAQKYKNCMKDMTGRAPGLTCIKSARQLQPKVDGGWTIPFDPKGGGCGGAMRAMCIGLRFPHDTELDTLIAIAVESGRMTHHHPTGYLGSLAAALFTAYAVSGKPTESWGKGLLDTLDKAKSYVKTAGKHVEDNLAAWPYFENQWKKYLQERGIADGKSKPTFPEKYGVVERDKFYSSVSYSGWGGSSGHDSTIIAYDAILGSGDSWIELCNRGVFHGGDNDSTGAIAAAWWGAMYGFQEVPKSNFENLEYKQRLVTLGEKLYELSHSSYTRLSAKSSCDAVM
ncbi:protein ADP-ribosylarginine hydrolase [Callorhinchus milii]|nr:protein ADP-ribosylarginine hydrolase [Callorhinchus milii]|eukprot:gi/632946934/ref/XP_007888806.1/ PREDICTED: ADP-ribosylarginine hydrolase [Callorhinchus milii]